MAKLLKWILLVPLALFAAALLTVQILRWWAVDESDREALAAMQVDSRPSGGRSGFAALAHADRRIPLDQLERVQAADVAAFEAWLTDPDGAPANYFREALFSHDADAMGSWSDAEAHRQVVQDFPAHSPAPLVDGTCSIRTFGCPEKVRQSPQLAEDLLHDGAHSLALADLALASDHLRSPYPAAWEAPSPSYSLLRLPLNQAALDSVQGRMTMAMSRACRVLAGARRIARQPEHLMDKLIGDALAEGAASLLLELRRENPSQPLPEECEEALQPVLPAEALACPSIRGEFRINAAGSQRMASALAASWHPRDIIARLMLSDADLTNVWMARSVSVYCSDHFVQGAMVGRIPPGPPEETISGSLECYAAILSCTLIDIGSPAYFDYQARMLDSAATLRVLLVAQAAAAGELQGVNLAEAAASPGYDVQFDPVGREFSLTLKKPRHNEPAPLKFRLGI